MTPRRFQWAQWARRKRKKGLERQVFHGAAFHQRTYDAHCAESKATGIRIIAVRTARPRNEIGFRFGDFFLSDDEERWKSCCGFGLGPLRFGVCLMTKAKPHRNIAISFFYGSRTEHCVEEKHSNNNRSTTHNAIEVMKRFSFRKKTEKKPKTTTRLMLTTTTMTKRRAIEFVEKHNSTVMWWHSFGQQTKWSNKNNNNNNTNNNKWRRQWRWNVKRPTHQHTDDHRMLLFSIHFNEQLAWSQ